MLAYSLEDNGYMRGNILSDYLDIINSEDKRKEYISSLSKIDCPFHKMIIENICSSY